MARPEPPPPPPIREEATRLPLWIPLLGLGLLLGLTCAVGWVAYERVTGGAASPLPPGEVDGAHETAAGPEGADEPLPEEDAPEAD